MTIEEAREIMESRRLKLEDVRQIPDDFLPSDIAANVIGVQRGRFTDYAKTGQLRFPVTISGNRVKVPRIAFLKHYGVDGEEEREKTVTAEEILKVLQHIDGGVKAIATIVLMYISETMPDRVKAAEAILNGGMAQ